jgi:L-ribulokinase
MTLVAGVDFGTQSVRVTIVDSTDGPLGYGVSGYPVVRTASDPDFATQSHDAHMSALVDAMATALRESKAKGTELASIALDTTGSTVVPVGPGLRPLDDYYLWCDHRAKDEAALITEVAHARKLPAIDRCGGVYSSEWGWAKLLHWLRHTKQRDQFVTALEHCDMVAAVLCGITDTEQLPRSVCAMGHKWLWHPDSGGLPPEEFLVAVDSKLKGVRGQLGGRYLTSEKIAGHLSTEWAGKLGLKPGIPIPIGAFDAHWDAMGAGIAEGDVVNVVGTATCIMAIAKQAANVPGVCGVVNGSIHPDYVGVEAGLSATGDLFEVIAKRANTTVKELAVGLEGYRAGQTGLMRFTWDNGDRTVLVNPRLGGVTLGWNMTSTMRDELFAAIEGCALHTRIILDQMKKHGVPIRRVIHGGGIPQKSAVLNQVYANAFNAPVLVPEKPITSLGSALFAFLAAGTFKTLEDAQKALCPSYRTVNPDPAAAKVYDELYSLYKPLYFTFGGAHSRALPEGRVLPSLREIAARTRG